MQALLRATRAHAGLALRPGGEQALANVLHVVELARQYEASDGASFRGFVQQFLDATHIEAGESPILEEGTDGVRLMTVHKAKGLEFPVVILADITCRLSSDRPSRALVSSRGLCVQTIAGCTPARTRGTARRGDGARSRRGPSARLRRRHARPGPAGRARRRRRAVPAREAGREVGGRHEPRPVSGPPVAGARASGGLPAVRARHRAGAARRGVGDACARRFVRGATFAATPWRPSTSPGGIPRGCISARSPRSGRGRRR